MFTSKECVEVFVFAMFRTLRTFFILYVLFVHDALIPPSLSCFFVFVMITQLFVRPFMANIRIVLCSLNSVMPLLIPCVLFAMKLESSVVIFLSKFSTRMKIICF